MVKQQLYGMCIGFVLLGIITIAKPIYYFRGDYADFTGYHKPVGIIISLIGIAFIIVGYRSKK